MKRILLLASVLLVASSTSAQVRITKNESPIRKVAGLTQVSALMQKDSIYFLLFVTDNRYDDPVLILLGEGREAALESLAALDEMMEGVAKDETFYLTDIDDIEYFVSRLPLTKYATLRSTARAGKATLHRVALRRAVEALTK